MYKEVYQIIRYHGHDPISGRAIAEPVFYAVTGNGSNRGPFASREQAEITLLKEEVGALRCALAQTQHDFRLLLELVAPEVLEKNYLGIETGLAGAIKRKTGAF